MTFYNLARMYTATTGTSTVILTTAVPGCLTFDLAGVPNGDVVKYGIITYDLATHRPTHTEVGTGTYTASGTTLARTTVEKSTNSNNKITLTGLSEVYLGPLASDFAGFGGGGGVSYASYYESGTHTITNNTNNQTVEIDSERVDASGLASVGSNTITISAAGAGDYEISLVLAVSSSTALNGYIAVYLNTTYTLVYKKTGYSTAQGIFSDYFYLNLFSQNVNTDTIFVKIDNHAGSTVNYLIQDITLVKLG